MTTNPHLIRIYPTDDDRWAVEFAAHPHSRYPRLMVPMTRYTFEGPHAEALARACAKGTWPA